MEGTHDDDLLPFISLQAATRNVIEYLIEKKPIDRGAKDQRRAEDDRSKQESRKLPIIGG